ncbi:MAG: aminotransferase class I/II-fold pyridoxal phosphate-dependent enzyme, partial [Planctomycetota bacterium]
MKIKPAQRVTLLPPYLFAEIDRQKNILRKQGKDIIDLSVGDPDLEPPAFMLRELKKALDLPAIHRYPPYQGTSEFCESIARWY